MKQFIKDNPNVCKVGIGFISFCVILILCVELFAPYKTVSNPWWLRIVIELVATLYTTLMLVCLLGMAGIDDKG